MSSSPSPARTSTSSGNAAATMTVDERFRIIRNVGKECTQEDELMNLLIEKPRPICYDGFEPCGRMDIAQGLMKTISVNQLTSAGCQVKIWVADWFAMLNNKMGGDFEKIKIIGEYMIEVWKAVGMNVEEDSVKFLWASQEIESRAAEYWLSVMKIALRHSVGTIKSCAKCMGLNKEDEFTAAQILYPCMQCADVFFLEADICQMGMDQQEVNLLAREYSDVIKSNNKPIILPDRRLPGLLQDQEMSKTDDSSVIFMDDEEADVNRKIKKAYCPPQQVDGNPCLDYIQYIIFPWFKEFKVERKAENGGDKTFTTVEELFACYGSGGLHPLDLKSALAKALNKILKPVRDHFRNDASAEKLHKRVKELTSVKSKTSKQNNKKKEKIPASSASTEQSSLKATNQKAVEERFRIIRSIGEECIQEDELMDLLSELSQPICYDGFEPSGRMHIAQGITKTTSVNKLTSAGCKVIIWIADWFAMLNNKMGGDLEMIQTVGRYMIEIWKAVGMNLEDNKVEFLWASNEINSRAHEYWLIVMDIARRNNLRRILRCAKIMGRNEEDDLTAAQILYPCMQCADIFFLKADICQLGMDQRKVNVLAREYCDEIKKDVAKSAETKDDKSKSSGTKIEKKPIILSHHMLPGLLPGQEKMSKSNAASAIFMEDDEAQINLKIQNAYCPPQIVEGNPCLEYIQYIVFPWFEKFEVDREAANGGEKTFTTPEELFAYYRNGELQPDDLKPALAKALNRIIQPVRDHFKNDASAKDLFETVKKYMERKRVDQT